MNQQVTTPYQNEQIRKLEEKLEQWERLSFQINETLCIIANNTDGYGELISELITEINNLRNKTT